MSALTPTLTERNARRTTYLAELLTAANSKASTVNHATLSHYDRWSTHPDPGVRARLVPDRRRRHEIGYRHLRLRKSIESLDLSKAADWAIFTGLGDYYSTGLFGEWYDLTKPLSEAVKKFSTLPVVALTAEEEAEWAYETTVHDIDEAMRVQVADIFGAGWDFIALGVDDLTGKDLDIAKAIKRRWKEIRGRKTLPDNPNDHTLWGRDNALTALTVTPKIGAGLVTLTPAFKTGVFDYTMEYRGDQILRTDATVRDTGHASSEEILETNRVIRRVTSECGDVQDYVIAGNDECYLSELEFGRVGYTTPYPYTPAFDKTVTAYVTAAPILAVRQFKPSFTTKGATGRVVVGPAYVDYEVTAADGETKRTYRVTSSHSG